MILSVNPFSYFLVCSVRNKLLFLISCIFFFRFNKYVKHIFLLIRSLVIQIQDEVNTKEGIITTSRKVELDLERRLMDVQQELAATVSDQQATQMDLSRIQALAERLKKKYLDLVDSKTAQTNNFASLEETKLVSSISFISHALPIES